MGCSGFPLWSPHCCPHSPTGARGGPATGLFPGLGHRQQSPGEPQPEPGNRVSSHRRAAPRAQGPGLGLRHWGEQGWAQGSFTGRAVHTLGPEGSPSWDLALGSVGHPSQSPLGVPDHLEICLCRGPRQPNDAGSSSRGAGITSLSGPMPPEPLGARPRRQLLGRVGSRASLAGPREWLVPCKRPVAPSPAEAEASSHLEASVVSGLKKQG